MRSVVSTVRPVRSQSIRGTRKFGSPAKFSASSEAAAASKRRSISSSHRLRQRLDDLDRLQPAQLRPGPLDQPRQPQEQVEVAREGARDPGPQHLDRDLRALGRHREMHLRDRGGGDRRCRRRRRRGSRAAARTRPRSARAPRRRERAAGGPAACARSSVISSPSRSARVDRIWPSLMKLGPSSVSAAASRSPGRPRGAGAAPPEQPGDAQTAARRRRCRSSGNSASCRARVSAIRTRRARLRQAAQEPEHRVGSLQSRQAECSAATPPVRLRNCARSRPAAAIISDNSLCGGKRRMLSTR